MTNPHGLSDETVAALRAIGKKHSRRAEVINGLGRMLSEFDVEHKRLGIACGAGASTVSYMCRRSIDSGNLRRKTAAKLADYLHLTVEQIFELTEMTPSQYDALDDIEELNPRFTGLAQSLAELCGEDGRSYPDTKRNGLGCLMKDAHVSNKTFKRKVLNDPKTKCEVLYKVGCDCTLITLLKVSRALGIPAANVSRLIDMTEDEYRAIRDGGSK